MTTPANFSFLPTCISCLQQAAAIYLSMVASGSLLYLIITAAGVKATTVDCCLSLIVCSWLGPAAHLGLLWLLPHNVYQQHRAMITLGFRLFYLLATSVNGFGVCGVGPIGSLSLTSKSVGTELQLESPMSAFLWRSGIIGLIWYAGAFPLLFWQHALVQTGGCSDHCCPPMCKPFTCVSNWTSCESVIGACTQRHS